MNIHGQIFGKTRFSTRLLKPTTFEQMTFDLIRFLLKYPKLYNDSISGDNGLFSDGDVLIKFVTNNGFFLGNS